MRNEFNFEQSNEKILHDLEYYINSLIEEKLVCYDYFGKVTYDFCPGIIGKDFLRVKSYYLTHDYDIMIHDLQIPTCYYKDNVCDFIEKTTTMFCDNYNAGRIYIDSIEAKYTVADDIPNLIKVAIKKLKTKDKFITDDSYSAIWTSPKIFSIVKNISIAKTVSSNVIINNRPLIAIPGYQNRIDFVDDREFKVGILRHPDEWFSYHYSNFVHMSIKNVQIN